MRVEGEGYAPVGSLLLHHGGGMLFTADRGVPSFADSEGGAHPKGAGHTGGPGRYGGRDQGTTEGETSLDCLSCAENRLEAVLRKYVQYGPIATIKGHGSCGTK